MTKKNGTKRSLLMSAVSLILCFSMLIGSTFAWFTDSVTSSGNIIASGKLDVEMSWADGKDDPTAAATVWTDASAGPIFNNDKWEPGYVDVKHIQIKNAGTLALKYQLNIAANGTVSKLADVIDVYFVDGGVQVPNRAALDGQTPKGTLAQMLAGMPNNVSGDLEEGESDTVTIALKMKESATNEYQNLSIGSDFAVQLFATQLEAEIDSFGDDYDAGATYPVVSAPVTLPSTGATATAVTVATEDVEVIVPADVVEELADGNVTSLTVAHAEPVVDTTNKKITFDAVDLVDQDGNVIDLEAMGNTTDLKVTLPVEDFIDGEPVAIYHDDELVATAVVTNGEITYSVKHFCMVVVEAIPGPAAGDFSMLATKTGEQPVALSFEDFRANVNAGNDYSGWTITLTKDIDFDGAEWTPIGLAVGQDLTAEGSAPFSGIFDGNGHTLSNFKVTNGVTVDGDPWLSLFTAIYAKDGNTAGVKNLTLSDVTYDNPNGTIGAIVNLADSDGASALEFSNINISGTVRGFGVYGDAGLATLMFGSEVTVSNVDLDLDMIIPADFTVKSYKFISPCIGQISLKENGHITFTNVDWEDCTFQYPSTFRLEDRSTVVAGYNSIWVYNTPAGISVLGCGGYSAQFYDDGVTFTIDGVDYTHAELKEEQKDYPGYMYDYIIRPDKFTSYGVE